MRTTRSKAPMDTADTSKVNLKATAGTKPQKPVKTLILPKNRSKEARIVSLPNPRTSKIDRYYFCPDSGLYEFTAITPAQTSPRSILFIKPSAQSTEVEDGGDNQTTEAKAAPTTRGSISESAELLIATPIDAIFMMLPILASAPQGSTKRLFQPLDDMLYAHDELPKHFRYIMENKSFRALLDGRLECICDTTDAGGDIMLRLNEEKLVRELVAKAERMTSNGLPASLEERFIKRSLETPLQSVRRDNTTNITPTEEGDKDTESAQKSDTATSASVSTTPSEGASAPITPLTEAEPESPNEVSRLLRLRTALSFLQASYLPPKLSCLVDAALASPESPVDFKPLTDRLQIVAKLREEALASRSLADFTRKRGLDDIAASEVRAEKRRLIEEEEKKKKAGESRGVRELKKVNTTGMKKMSDFFGKAAAKKKT